MQVIYLAVGAETERHLRSRRSHHGKIIGYGIGIQRGMSKSTNPYCKRTADKKVASLLFISYQR